VAERINETVVLRMRGMCVLLLGSVSEILSILVDDRPDCGPIALGVGVRLCARCVWPVYDPVTRSDAFDDNNTHQPPNNDEVEQARGSSSNHL
jgi:hypothetical protein